MEDSKTNPWFIAIVVGIIAAVLAGLILNYWTEYREYQRKKSIIEHSIHTADGLLEKNKVQDALQNYKNILKHVSAIHEPEFYGHISLKIGVCYNTLGRVGNKEENLKNAIEGESYEVATMYPNFLKDASNEKVNIAMMSFNYAFQTEKKHKELYENALNSLDNNQVNSMPSLYQVCLVCGNTYAGQGPARCGICMTPNEKFVTLKL